MIELLQLSSARFSWDAVLNMKLGQIEAEAGFSRNPFKALNILCAPQKKICMKRDYFNWNSIRLDIFEISLGYLVYLGLCEG